MTIPMKDKSINRYPKLCSCFKCECNRVDQCTSRGCTCCMEYNHVNK